MAKYDVAIVGGSAMGSTTAYYLGLLDPALAVAVVERDPTYEYTSTLRSDGNLRIQFNLEENVRMSQYTMELLESFADDMEVEGWRPDPAARHQGNLFLVDGPGEVAARAGLELQRSLGCDVEWMDADRIAARWPLYATVGAVGGVFGPRDGYIDPSAVLHAFRRNAVKLGAEYITAEATRVRTAGGGVSGLELDSGMTIDCDVVVNCAGGWATALAATAGVAVPVQPVMRTVFVVESPFDVTGLPSVFLPSGVYAIPEGSNSFEMAWSRPDDPVGFDFTFSRARFGEIVWPELIETLPGLDRLSVTGGWCGVYAMNTLDANAILGEWPELSGYFMANGFSGHGFQHTPAMGRYLAELITGSAVSLDLSRLGPQRIIDGQPLYEHAGRII